MAVEDTESERLLAGLHDPQHRESQQVLSRGRAFVTVDLLVRYAEALQESGRLENASKALQRALAQLQERIDEAAAQDATDRVKVGAVGLDTTYAQVLRQYALLLRQRDVPEAEEVDSRARALLAAADTRRANLITQLRMSTHKHDR